MSDKCYHCGFIHLGVICPRIKSIEYNPDGTAKKIEYHAPSGDNPMTWTSTCTPAKRQ